MTAKPDNQNTLEVVKTILRRDLKIGHDVEIDESMPLKGGDYEIDSLDVLLLLISIEKEFNIKIPNESVGETAFQNISSLVDFIDERIAST